MAFAFLVSMLLLPSILILSFVNSPILVIVLNFYSISINAYLGLLMHLPVSLLTIVAYNTFISLEFDFLLLKDTL